MDDKNFLLNEEDKMVKNMVSENMQNEISSDLEVNERSGIVIPSELSLLPIKDTVLFPMVVMPLIVSRESSMKLVDDAVVSDTRIIMLSSLKDPNIETPTINDIYPVGVAAAIHTMLRLPEHQRLIVQGLKRVRVVHPTGAIYKSQSRRDARYTRLDRRRKCGVGSS